MILASVMATPITVMQVRLNSVYLEKACQILNKDVGWIHLDLISHNVD